MRIIFSLTLLFASLSLHGELLPKHQQLNDNIDLYTPVYSERSRVLFEESNLKYEFSVRVKHAVKMSPSPRSTLKWYFLNYSDSESELEIVARQRNTTNDGVQRELSVATYPLEKNTHEMDFALPWLPKNNQFHISIVIDKQHFPIRIADSGKYTKYLQPLKLQNLDVSKDFSRALTYLVNIDVKPLHDT